MTNLEIIKYLATNNPARLAELLESIYCMAWNDGAWDRIGDESSIPSFEKWIYEDAIQSGMYHNYELEQWSKAINPTPTITAFYDGLTVTIPVDDPDHLWNKDIYNSKYEIIDQAIDEIKLLENILDAEKIPRSVYNNFRKNACMFCSDQQNCLRSDIDIVECLKDENWEDWV